MLKWDDRMGPKQRDYEDDEGTYGLQQKRPEYNSAHILTSNLWLPECKKCHFCCLKSPTHLNSLVTWPLRVVPCTLAMLQGQ